MKRLFISFSVTIASLLIMTLIVVALGYENTTLPAVISAAAGIATFNLLKTKTESIIEEVREEAKLIENTDSNGNITSCGYMLGDNKVGTWEYFDESGALVKEDEFLEGQNVKTILYENGEIKSEITHSKEM